jgi:hydrogenase nickel incorporation protein HypB
MSIITIERKVLEKNDAVAGENRALLDRHGTIALNVVSSPGAGKTTLLERTLEELDGTLPVAVVEGDVETDLDARRLTRFGLPVVQLVTRGACHLDAALVREALLRLNLAATRLLIIENVGNLVCPAGFDLGEAAKVVLLSVAEGDDKPLKYPAMFRNSQVLVITKMDLCPHVRCDVARMRERALQVNPALRVFETSAVTGQGIAAWCAWLRDAARGVPGGAR